MATILLFALNGCQTAPRRSEAQTLSAAEVKQLFIGDTVESYNLNNGMTSFTYYHPNGTLDQERLWLRRSGNWSVREDGQICLAFAKARLRCRHIVRSGDKYYKVRVDEQGNEKRIIRYRHFAEGNAFAER